MCVEKFKDESLREKQHRMLVRMAEEYRNILNMGEAEFRSRFVDPPTGNLAIYPFQSVDPMEAAHEAGLYGEKLVFLDLIIEEGNCVLVARNMDKHVEQRLLTFQKNGLTRRHFNIDPTLGLALSKDGSLRGLLMDEPNKPSEKVITIVEVAEENTPHS